MIFNTHLSVLFPGNLHLANVISRDKQNGRQYVCIVQNTVMRRTQHGDYQKVSPQGGM